MSETDDIRAAIENLKKKATRRPPPLWRRIIPYLDDIREARSSGVNLPELAQVFGAKPGTLSRAIRDAEEFLAKQQEEQK